jgi:hypothetical protein
MEFKNVKFLPKGDIAANWDKATHYIPDRKEIIEYLPDAEHPYTRLKIGDGVTALKDLPFLGQYQVASIVQQIQDLKDSFSPIAFSGNFDDISFNWAETEIVFDGGGAGSDAPVAELGKTPLE